MQELEEGVDLTVNFQDFGVRTVMRFGSSVLVSTELGVIRMDVLRPDNETGVKLELIEGRGFKIFETGEEPRDRDGGSKVPRIYFDSTEVVV